MLEIFEKLSGFILRNFILGNLNQPFGLVEQQHYLAGVLAPAAIEGPDNLDRRLALQVGKL